jgi:DNA-binding YbaB/EbfC family protein
MIDQFKNLKDLAGLMGNASQLKEKFQQMQADLERIQVEAEAGAGAVRVTVNGKFKVLAVALDRAMIAALIGDGGEDPEADKQMIEQLVLSATNAALAKAQEQIGQQMGQLTGGMNIPGLDNLLGSGT